MDVHNVTEEYTQLISRQKQTLLDAKRRQGQRPRDRKSREVAYGMFMVSLMSTGNKDLHGIIHSSFIPPAYQPCTTPISQLRRIAIKDLQLETHHRGTNLLLRSITPPNRMTAIMALMEDENGEVILLQLYQQEDEDARAATDIVKIGTVLLVKEPYYKVMGDGEYGLRVDHLSDIIHLEGDDPRIPDTWQPQILEIERSAESLKVQGNLAMKDGRYWDAIKEYSDALRQPITANETEIIKRNRSLAFLKTKHFDAALSDTGFPDFNPNLAEKAMFRAAEALYHLERFTECCEVLELLCTHFPHNAQASVARSRAQIRSQEQRTGVYNFTELQAMAKKLRPPQLDHASYIGPVEIRQAGSRGRGLFVTKAVKAGDLLLCEKAYGYAYVGDDMGGNNKSGSKITLLLNPETGQGFMGTQADLIKAIVQKLYRNTSLARVFTALYHGTYETASTSVVDEKAVVDTFLVERIISFNVFGCPSSTLVSYAKILGINSTSVPENSIEEAHHSCGIWPQASYINHSCTSNARRAFIGNMMIVRASRDMEAGDEITFWYQSPDDITAKEMQEKLKNWGFTCRCAICEDERATDSSVSLKKDKLMKDVKNEFSTLSVDAARVAKIEHLLDVVNQTYSQPAEKVPRLLIWAPQLALVRLFSTSNANRTIHFVGKLLTSLGFVLVGADLSNTRFVIFKWGLFMGHLAEIFLHARNAFAAMGATEDSGQAEEYARTAYKTVVGEDSTFDETHP